LNNHGDLTGEEENNPGEEFSGNEASSTWQTTVESIIINRNCYEYFASTSTLLRPSKMSRVEQLLSITIVYLAAVTGTKVLNNWKRMRILLDSSCAAPLINHSQNKTLDSTQENKIKWTTKIGEFSTHRWCEITFTLPALHKHREITWKCYVDESNPKANSHDLIIGGYLIHEIGIDICFSAAEVRWDNASMSMQSVDKSTEQFEQELLFTQDI
jgi:hypothetical protein